MIFGARSSLAPSPSGAHGRNAAPAAAAAGRLCRVAGYCRGLIILTNILFTHAYWIPENGIGIFFRLVQWADTG